MRIHPALRRFLLAAAILLLAAAAAPGSLTAQPQSPRQLIVKPGAPPPNDSVVKNPTLITTFSGGISLGAYQAGVDWALLEFYRAANRDGRFAERWRLPRYRFGTAAGASAGNINALLWAIETCTKQERGQRPEASLFWKVWTNIDIETLLPENPGDSAELALLDRGFIDSLYDTIADRTRSDSLDPQCKRPLGITLTRVLPETLKLAGGISFRSQRYVVPLLATVNAGGNRSAPTRERLMHFSRPDISDHRLGPVRHPPRGPDGTTVPLEHIFPVVKASSAFPVAFAPVTLELERGDAAKAVPEMFVDGGLFDNNPVDLALVLHRALGLEPFADTVTGPSAKYQLLYVDPDNPRPGAAAPGCPSGRLGGKPSRCDGIVVRDPLPGGLRPVLSLLGGAFTSAREYELFALSRSLPRDTINWQLLTTRRHPVVGERLVSFGAFLNRAYREHDFYVGAYDAIHFVLCEAPGREVQPQRVQELCTYPNAIALRDALALPGGAATHIERMARAEFNPAARERIQALRLSPRPQPTPGEEAVGRVYESIFEALLYAEVRDTSAARRAVTARCQESLSWWMVCRDGTDRFLNLVRTGLLKQDESACGTRSRPENPEMAAVLAHFQLCELVRLREDEYFQVYFDRLMRRLVQVERDVDAGVTRHNASVPADSATPGGAPMQAAAEVISFLYHSTSLQPKVGWHWGSLPPDAPLRWRLAPTYITTDAHWDGIEAGWQPVWYSRAHPGTGLGFPVGVRWNNPSGHDGIPHWFYMAGARLVMRNPAAFGSIGRSRTEVGLLYVQPARDLWDGALGGTLAAELSTGLIADQLRLSARYALLGDPVDGTDRLQFSLGLNDVGGFAYWLTQVSRR